MPNTNRTKLFLTLGVIVALIIWAAQVYYASASEELEFTTSQQLAAISELKTAQINQWLWERRSDAVAAARNPFLSQAVTNLLAHPENLALKSEVEASLLSIKEAYGYSSIALFDASGRLITSSTGRDSDFSPQEKSSGDDFVTLSWNQPVGKPGAPVGAVLMLIQNLHSFVSPIIQHWPTPSPSAETLLLRKDGTEVVFLTAQRHAQSSSTSNRLSLSLGTNYVSVLAAAGQTGYVQGLDYRGEPVVAYISKVPGTTWIMISKIDHAEVNGPLLKEATEITLIALLGIIASIFAVGWWWRQHNAVILEKQLENEKALSKKDHRLVSLMRETNDTILVLSEEMRITECNDQASTLYGYAASELRGLHVTALRSPELRSTLEADLQTFQAEGGARYETVHLRKDGTSFPVEVGGHATRTNGHFEIIAVIRDISQRKQAEARIKRLNELYAALSTINQAIVKATSRETLFREICHGLVQKGGFKMAWMGWIDPDGQHFRPVAVEGDTTGFTQNLVLSLAPSEEDQCPTAIAIREKRIYPCPDFFSDPATIPWREGAVKAGLNSFVALPLSRGGRIVGSLTAYAGETDYFGPAEMDLLEEAQQDISFALDNLLKEETARKTGEALREREEMLGAIFSQAVDSIALVDPETGRFVEFNDAAHQTLGYTAVEFARMSVTDIEPDHTPEEIRESIVQMQSLPTGKVIEARHRCKDGSIRDVIVSARNIRLRGQDYLTTIWTDITERKKAEIAMRERKELFRLFFQHTPSAIAMLDRDMRYLMTSERWLTDYHLENTEVIGRSHYDIFPEIPEKWRQIHQRCLAGETEKSEGEPFTRADGTVDWIRWEIRPWYTGVGKVGGIIIFSEDITGRKRADEKIRLSELKFHTLFDRAPIPLAMSGLNGDISYLNEPFQQLLGYSSEDLKHISQWWRLAYPDPEYRKSIQSRWEKAIADSVHSQGRVAPIECRITGKDGLVRTMEVSATMIDQEMLVALVDLTQRRKAEEDFLLEQEFNRALLENLQAGVVACDSNGSLRLFNLTAREWHGLGPTDVDQREWAGRYDLFESDGRTPLTVENIPLARAFRGENVRAAQMVIAPKGRPARQIITNASAVMSKDGRKLGAVAVMHDITEQLASQAQALIQSLALNAAANAITITDQNGIIIWANQAFSTLTGYQLDEIIGQSHRVLKSGLQEPGFYHELWKKVSSGQVWQGELKNRRKDGTIYEEEMTITPVRNAYEQITHYIAIKQDVSARRDLERQYYRAQRMEGIGLLAGGIAHDLNNVLAPILMSVELLRDQNLPAEVVDILETMETSATRGSDIVKQVLTFARGVDGHKGPVQLRHLVKDMTRMARETFPRNIHIKSDIASDLAIVKADATQLHQVLLNLSVNARDAMPDGGELEFTGSNVTLSASDLAKRPGLQPGDYVRLTVRDTGMGMTPEVVERIFDPFFTTKDQGKGTGLGLSTVLGIMRGHHGVIEVESSPGNGSIFTLLFPAMPSSELSETDKKASQLPKGRNELILLVDDEASVLRISAAVLRRSGYRVLTAGNGAEALSTYVQHQGEIAAVLTDVMMPIMDGVMLIKQLHRLDPELRCIAASGMMGTNEQMRTDELKANGVKHILVKPFTMEDMLTALDEELHR